MSNEQKNFTLGAVLSWVFAVVFFVGGLGLIGTDSVVAGVIMLMAAMITCPITFSLIEKNANATMSAPLRIVLIVVLLVVSVVTMPSANPESDVPASSPQSINTEDTDPSASTEPAAAEEEVAVEETQEETPDLELLEGTETTSDEFSRYIEGKVRNNTDHEYSYVQITFNLYDDEGALVDTALANVNNLEPGGIWKFKAIMLNDEATSYKLGELTGF